MKAVLRVTAFPLILAASVAVAWWLLGAGVSPLAVIVTVSPVAAAFVIALEWTIPFRREWLRDQGDLRTDCIHLVVSAWVVESLPALGHGALIAGAIAVSGAVGRPPWPTEAPVWAQLGLALLVSELIHYTLHRALHAFDPMWRLHAVHHSAPRLYWLNATRVHPLEGLLHIATGATVLVVAGVPSEVLTLHAVWLGIGRLFQHANIDVRLGVLNLVFSGTEVHRFHHSIERGEADANYGNNLLVWDWVFGTRRAVPHASAPAQIGGPRLPAGWWGQVTSPFRRDTAG